MDLGWARRGSPHEAAPRTAEFNADAKILIWRPCLKVVASWMGLGMFQPGWEEPYHMFYDSIKKFCPRVLDYTQPVEQAASFWIYWNELARPHVDKVFAIESLTAQELLDYLEIPGRVDEPPRDTNHRNDVKQQITLTHEDLGWVAGHVRTYENDILGSS